MTTLQELIGKPFFETRGSGKVSFEDGLELDADFSIQMLSNGKIVGDLALPISYYGKISEFQREAKWFSLKGKSGENKENIISENCYLTGLEASFGGSDSSLKCRFSVQKFLINPESLETTPARDLLIQFGIVNVYRTLGVSVQSALGRITLTHYKGIEDMERLMQRHGLPLITSLVELAATPDGATLLRSIVDKAVQEVQGFLKISSLAQTVWHEWVFLQVYEKVPESDNYQLIFTRLRSPKLKAPTSRGITNPAHSSNFFEAAWKGYSSSLNEEYGFDVALEWYIESNISSVLESKFLNATTCLEMLMDKFHSRMGSEFLLKQETFETLYEFLKKQASQWLKDKDIDETTRAALYRTMSGTNRRSYVDKARMLLEYWGVSYTDTGTSLEDIVDVRNDITHRGMYYSKNGGLEFEKAIKAYEGLFIILTRIFLVMLAYDDQYFDPVRREFVGFREVCSKVGSTSS